MEPLAHRLRPTKLEDVIGQDFLTGKDGIITKMIQSNHLQSFVLYGGPGTGKTTIGKIIKEMYSLESYEFNASSDSKAILQEITNLTKFYPNVVLIIDEIHRMKKDTQDYLLPYLEDGRITIIGLTTSNPYISINKAIRSRLNIYQMNSITEDDIIKLLKRTIEMDEFKHLDIDDDVLRLIATSSGCEIRTSLNMLESLELLNGHVDIKEAKKVLGIKAMKLDYGEDNYYDLLSALQKSIRGSDVDASLYYLARLIRLEDLDIITRRLMIIAYEDIGLANPQVGPRTYLGCQAALHVGLPECRIILSELVIDLALSPKSNTAESSIDKALKDVDEASQYDIPKNILNREIKGGVLYKYPHDYPGDIVYQEYMPKEIRDHVYYEAKETGKYERALKEQNQKIRQILKK